MKFEEKIRIKGGLRMIMLVVSMLALLGGSVFVWFYVRNSVNIQRNSEILNIVERTEERVQDTINSAVERLYDLRGYLISNNVNSDKWQKYLESIGVRDRYPGVYTFAYAPRIERNNLDEYLSNLKVEEKMDMYRQYGVFPPSQNAEVFPIKYLFTEDRDVESMLGYDIGTSETQVAAIKTAITNDNPTITDLLHLDLVIRGSSKVGYVVMLPVYSEANIEIIPKEERKQYFVGLVGVWIFPSGLLTQLEVRDVLESKSVSLKIFDGNENILSIGTGNGNLKQEKKVEILGKTFRFEFVGEGENVLSELAESLPWITTLVLIVVNLMWGATVFSILAARREAEKLAIEATKDLRKFKQAVEGVSDLVIITDISGVILYSNKAAEMITGFRKESLLGKTPALWGKQMDKEYYQKFWKTIKTDKKPFWGEITNKKKSGELYEAEINVSPIFDDSGNLLFFVGIERDLSKIKAVEHMKTEFISLASHQLRTPLSAVKWFGKMLIDGEAGKLTPTQTEYVDNINQSNEREIKLVNALLNVSRIESGKILLVPKRTNLSALVMNAVTDFKIEAEKAGEKIAVVMDKKIPEINIDEDLIRHVYTNVISNAVRYSKKNGKIMIKVYISKNYVMTEVKDNGIGVPKGEQKRVFDKFFRASNALKKETDGNGLGLYLSKTIVESSGGKIGFRSSEGKGSTFWFSLPIKQRETKGKML